MLPSFLNAESDVYPVADRTHISVHYCKMLFYYYRFFEFRSQHHMWWRLPVRKVGVGDRMRLAVFLT